MDLELSDEQQWLSESVETLLAREAADRAAVGEPGRVRRAVGRRRGRARRGRAVPDRSRARRPSGARPVPGQRRRALRGRAAGRGPRRARRGARGARAGVELGGAARPDGARDGRRRRRRHRPQDGRGARRRRPAPRRGRGRAARPGALRRRSRRARRRLRPAALLRPDGADVRGRARRGPARVRAARRRRDPRMATIGALLAAAEAVGAAGRMLEDACGYAAERRQFGRTIGSFQALRHLLADMYVRQASSWSSVLYAAAALDEDAGDAARTVSIAKAYVSRAAREVAHGAMQVFGGIAVTEEHPAHRFLRRIVVRERQFGDAAHHERALGRRARRRRRPRGGELMSAATAGGFDDPTAQRLEPITTGAEPRVVGPLLADALHDPRWLACDVALISGGKSNLTYRVACDAGEVVLRRPPLGHVLPTAHDMVREHRVLQALEGTAVPVPRVLHLGRRRRAAGRRLLRDGARGRPRVPQRAAAGLRRRSRGAGGDRGGARRRPRRPARRRPGRGRPGRLRPAGRLRRAPAAPLVAAVGGLQDRRAARARRAARRARAHAAAAARRGDRPRRLPARQHDPAPDGARPHRRRARLGDEHARRPADRPRHAARLLERGRPTTPCSPRRA